MMANQQQKNIIKLSVHSKTISRNRSKPSVSRVNEMKHHHPSSEKSYSTPVKAISLIHTTIRTPKKEDTQKNRNIIGNKNNLLAFSSILSTRQRQNILRSSSLNHPLDFNKIRTIQPRGSSIATEHYSHRDEDHEQSWMRKYSSRSSRIVHSEVTPRIKNEHSTVLDETKKRKYCNKKSFCSCSIPCILLCLLIGLLLIGAIVGSIVGVFTASKASTSTTTSTTLTTTTTTTTVITTVCSCLCANESWTYDSDRLARWSFDDTLSDIMNTYNATSINNPSFVTNGYVNQALFFTATLIQSLFTSYIPLANISFTIEAWLKPTLFPNLLDHSILGLCPIAAAHQCLQLVIRTINSNHYLYFGFFADDCQGNTSVTLNQWIHVAFVFDITTLRQSIYFNGILDNSCLTSAPFMASMGSITIGTIPATIPLVNLNFYEGYIDHLTITQRAKSSCEILEDATLVTCFLFDATSPYTDSGPNSLLSSELSASIVPSGLSDEAISLNGTAYFQASSFTSLGLATAPFSMILWIRPRSALGPIFHVSSMANGQGWCFSFLGISANGSIIAQIFDAGAVTIWGPTISMAPVWSHIIQTWSSTNGLRLYVNNVLVASKTSAVVYAASGVSNFVTLANSLNGYAYCAGGGLGSIEPQSLDCDIDDFQLYSRELTASDVSTIYYSR